MRDATHQGQNAIPQDPVISYIYIGYRPMTVRGLSEAELTSTARCCPSTAPRPANLAIAVQPRTYPPLPPTHPNQLQHLGTLMPISTHPALPAFHPRAQAQQAHHQALQPPLPALPPPLPLDP